jgi:hypothetical protein
MSEETRPTHETVGDDSVLAATGRSREDWFALLDAENAESWNHTDIAAWLVDSHGVDGWWAQGVTIAYEQARGLREPGQRRDGSWEASASKTLYVSPHNLWPYLGDAHHRREWIGKDWPEIGQTEPVSVRLRGEHGSKVTLRIDELAPSSDGRHRVRLAAQHAGLASSDDIAPAKALWKDAYARLADRLSET